MTAIIIRRTEKSQAAQFASLHLACWHEAYTGIIPQAILDRANLAERTTRWQQMLADPERLFSGPLRQRRP